METKKDYTIEIEIYTKVLNDLIINFENNYYYERICEILNSIHLFYIDNNINYNCSWLEIIEYLINNKPENTCLDYYWFPTNKKGLQSRIKLVRKVIKDLNKL